jgi:hypothetical protein
MKSKMMKVKLKYQGCDPCINAGAQQAKYPAYDSILYAV